MTAPRARRFSAVSVRLRIASSCVALGALLVLSSGVAAAGAANAVGAHRAPVPHKGIRSDDWPTYFYDPERAGDNLGVTDPNVGNASHLKLVWTHEVPRAFDGSLIVVNGVIYAGSESGFLYALNAATGTKEHGWKTPFLGNTSAYSQCGLPTQARGALFDGLTSTPAYLNGKIYEDGGYPAFYQLGLNGSILGKTDLANSSFTPWYYDYEWSSPLVTAGHAYVGTAALCEYDDGQQGNNNVYKYVQGQLIKIDLSTMKIQHIFNVTKGGKTSNNGGSIWSSPALDPSTNTVWVTTGNANTTSQTPSNGEYPQSIIALNATTLKLKGGCQVVSAANANSAADFDFGAGPTIFHDAKGDRYVGAVNKDGYIYTMNATTFGTTANSACTGGTLKIAWTAGPFGYSGSGDISPMAFDGTNLYLASGSNSSSSSGSNGFLTALNPANGNPVWKQPYPLIIGSTSYEAEGGVSEADGIVYVDADNAAMTNGGALFALYASNGTLAFAHAFNESINGPPVIAEGMVFVATGSTSFTGVGYVDAFAP